MDESNGTNDTVVNPSGLSKEIKAMQSRAMAAADFVSRLWRSLILTVNGQVWCVKRITREHE
jgi:hypothetical protein